MIWNRFLIYALICLSPIVAVANTESTTNSPFIVPEELSDAEDVFTRNKKEYVYVNYPMPYYTASVLCNVSYRGRLAFIKTVDLATFLAEALSETNLVMEVLWVGAKLVDYGWYWYDLDRRDQEVSSSIIQLFVNYSQSVESSERTCLAIGRKNHDVPHFPALKCSVKRAFMCEREVSKIKNGSTHLGWIRIGPRLYKIFQEKVTWMNAAAKCILYDRDSRLAVLVNFPHSQALGRYLLVGRPSLENAWVGAKYYKDHYKFLPEDIVLANTSNAEGFPPWRNGTIQKRNGCILLDRHMSNITLFVEARCDRLRPYVCYKRDISEEEDSFDDIIIDEFGYRVYFNKLFWYKARDKCNTYKEKYQGQLAEIRERRIVIHLIYAMGQNKTAVQHIWVGGVFDSEVGKWKWDSDGALVEIKILDWLKNNTYLENVEKYNTCLNMDRENHLKAIHYGTMCNFAQNYICMFPKEKLLELEKDEGRNVTRRVFRRVKRKTPSEIDDLRRNFIADVVSSHNSQIN